jgi:hypothetical protein
MEMENRKKKCNKTKIKSEKRGNCENWMGERR